MTGGLWGNRRVLCKFSADPASGASRGDQVRALRAVKAALAAENVTYSCELEILFTGDSGIHELNARHRGRDEPTDVLSFPFQDAGVPEPGPDGRVCLGSVVINLPRCRAQAEEYGHDFARELCYLTAHSVLHLLGCDHQTEAETADMRAREERVMQALGLPRAQRRRGVFGFREAGRGLAAGLRERNVRVHIAAAASVSVLGISLRIDRVSWALLALCFGLVIGLELCNTAIETLCDRVDTAPDERIRRSKDIAAAAVLAAALAGVGVGIAVFSQPELWRNAEWGRIGMIGLGVAAADAIFIFAGGSK